MLDYYAPMERSQGAAPYRASKQVEKNQYGVSVCVAKMLFVLAEWLDFILVGPDGSGLDRWGIRAA